MSRNYRHCSSVDDQPSFSSTLLDAIYRSIDDNCESYEGEKQQQRRRSFPHRKEDDAFLREPTRKRNGTNYKSYCNHRTSSDDGTGTNVTAKKKSGAAYLDRDHGRGYLVDQWRETTVMIEKHVVCHKSSALADLDYKSRRNSLGSKLNLNSNSSSSSSDSSCGGGGGLFSSSDTDSSQYGRISSNSLKPIRTAQKPQHQQKQLQSDSGYQNRKGKSYYHSAPAVASSDQKPRHQHDQREHHSKAKSRAMKIYGDLKRMKQPISPGGKLASFLNSLFNSGSAKKQRISSSSERLDGGVGKSERAGCTPSTTTYSTASSFSRSCLSKTPSSAGTGRFEQSGVKRSVRFCPVSVVVDEDCRPCGEKALYGKENDAVTVAGIGGVRRRVDESILGADEDFKFQITKKNRHIEELARGLLKNYHNKDGVSGGFVMNEEMKRIKQLEEEEDDDNVSCSSSDLFELENLLEIGVDRFCEELPVYETTHMDTNRAIANGLIV